MLFCHRSVFLFVQSHTCHPSIQGHPSLPLHSVIYKVAISHLLYSFALLFYLVIPFKDTASIRSMLVGTLFGPHDLSALLESRNKRNVVIYPFHRIVYHRFLSLRFPCPASIDSNPQSEPSTEKVRTYRNK